MPAVSFHGLLIVAVVAFLAPLLLDLSPAPGRTRDRGGYCDWSVRTRLGQSRPADLNSLGAWAGLPALSGRYGSRA